MAKVRKLPNNTTEGHKTSCLKTLTKSIDCDSYALYLVKESQNLITGASPRAKLLGLLSLISGVCIFLRISTGLSSYSGQGISPMFGDYEAQRHWMEITLHLPLTQWYFYDLDYWGLDYPPLTAFHSLLCGFVSHYFNPSWVALDASRGFESVNSKIFMRLTALLSDLAIFLPSAIFFSLSQKKSRQDLKVNNLNIVLCFLTPYKLAGLLLLLINPCFYLIDHGHFQYNCVMLGLTVLSVAFFSTEHYLLGAISFVLALGFKQMALYFALPIFFFLLGKSFLRGFFSGIFYVCCIGFVTLSTFFLTLYPFILRGNALNEDWGITQLKQIGFRVFPLARGLYEDKVANLWCAINVFIKLRSLYSTAFLARVSAIATLIALIPSCINLFQSPSIKRLVYSLSVSSLSFYLLGFQVHEKTILLPALPIALLYIQGTESSTLLRWFTNVAVFSMYPLLKKDGLTGVYISSLFLWNIFTLPAGFFSFKYSFTYTGALEIVSATMMILLHLAEICVPAPSRYPDIYIVMNVLISAPHFLVLMFYLNYKQFQLKGEDFDVNNHYKKE